MHMLLGFLIGGVIFTTFLMLFGPLCRWLLRAYLSWMLLVFPMLELNFLVLWIPMLSLFLGLYWVLWLVSSVFLWYFFYWVWLRCHHSLITLWFFYCLVVVYSICDFDVWVFLRLGGFLHFFSYFLVFLGSMDVWNRNSICWLMMLLFFWVSSCCTNSLLLFWLHLWLAGFISEMMDGLQDFLIGLLPICVYFLCIIFLGWMILCISSLLLGGIL